MSRVSRTLRGRNPSDNALGWAWTAMLNVLILLLVSGSGSAASVGWVSLEGAGDPRGCVENPPDTCPIVVTPGPIHDPGSHRIGAEAGIQEVRLSPPAPLFGAVEVEPRSLAIRHPAFRLLNATWQDLNHSRPEPLEDEVAFESRPSRYPRSDGTVEQGEWGIFLMVYPPGHPGVTTARLNWNLFVSGNYLRSNETTFQPFPENVYAIDWNTLDWPAFYTRAAVACHVPSPALPICPILRPGHPALSEFASRWENSTPTFSFRFRLDRAVLGPEAPDGNPPTAPTHELGEEPSRPRLAAAWARPPEGEPAGQRPATPGVPSPFSDATDPPPSGATVETAVEVNAAPGNWGQLPLLTMLTVAAALLGLLGALLYHRIARQRALDQGTRHRIVELLAAEPGLRLGTIARRLGLDYTTVRHHVRLLMEFGLVAAAGEGQRRYYAAGRSQAGTAMRNAVLETASAREVYQRLLERGAVAQGQIVQETGLPHSTISQAVDRLVAAGLILTRRERGRVVVELPDFHQVGSNGLASPAVPSPVTPP